MAEDVLPGRQRELGLLDAALDRAAAGRAGALLFAGDPGIGKSRLLEEAVRRASARSWTVLRGGASAAEGMPPYLPFLEALGSHVRRAPVEQLRDVAGPDAAILAAILPELTWRLGDLAPAYALPPEQSRLRLFDAIGVFLSAIAGPAPVLLVLDDLHWADAATLDLLCFLLRRGQRTAMLVAGAYRDGDAAENPSFERTFAELVRQRVLTSVAVGPLDAASIAALSQGLLGARPGDSLSATLFAQGEGNPFFTEELLRGWVESGEAAMVDGEWQLTAPAGAGLSLPPTIAAAVRQRLARLPATLVDLLHAAAVMGRSFDLNVLATVASIAPEPADASLHMAIRARLLREEAPGRFRFEHDRVREALYAEIPTTVRVRLHAAIGAAIEAHSDPSPRRSADLAFHYARAGAAGVERAVFHAEAAGRAALAAFAGGEAEAQFANALSWGGTDHPRRGRLLTGQGEALMLAGHYDRAAAAYRAASAWEEQNAGYEQAALAAAEAGRAAWRAEQHVTALEAFDRALHLLRDGAPAQRCRVLVDRAGLLALGMHQAEQGQAGAELALTLARTLGDPKLEAPAARIAGNLRLRRGEMDAGLALVRSALAMAETAGDAVEAAECCAALAVASSWRADVRASQAYTLRRLDHARRTRDPFEMRHIHSWLAQCAVLLGAFDEAERLLGEAQQHVQHLDSPEPRSFYLVTASMLWFERGDDAAALAALEEGVAILRELASGAEVWFLGPLAQMYTRLGRHSEARALVSELETLIAGFVPGAMQVMEGATALGELAILLGDPALAARILPYIQPFDGYLPWMTVTYTLAGVALLLGDLDAAHEYLVRGETHARSQGLLPELGRTLVRRAAYERRRGRPGAERLEQEALAIFERTGMAREAAELRRQLPVARRPALPCGLSEREAEVLRLVVGGLSNRRIARALYLSEKTVANHLTSIFTKTGCDNRVAAATFAIRHGLG